MSSQKKDKRTSMCYRCHARCEHATVLWQVACGHAQKYCVVVIEAATITLSASRKDPSDRTERIVRTSAWTSGTRGRRERAVKKARHGRKIQRARSRCKSAARSAACTQHRKRGRERGRCAWARARRCGSRRRRAGDRAPCRRTTPRCTRFSDERQGAGEVGSALFTDDVSTDSSSCCYSGERPTGAP